jgi:hypothetical protein
LEWVEEKREKIKICIEIKKNKLKEEKRKEMKK